MDASHLGKNAWDKSGMVFILMVIRGLELMWTIWSCCMTCCTSQANCIFSGFSCFNPSLKSRFPNIVWFRITFCCNLQLDWFPAIETGKDIKKKSFSWFVFVHFYVLWRTEVNLFSVAHMCFQKRCSVLGTELKQNLPNCFIACCSCLSVNRYWL